MDESIKRLKRGDKSPNGDGKVFLRYARGKEVWATPQKLQDVLAQQRRVNAKQRKKPGYNEKMKLYFRSYNKTSKQKSYHSKYYKQPHVRKRVRDKWNIDPKTLERRTKRAAKRAERRAYLKSLEYLAIRAAKHQAWIERNRDSVRAYERHRYATVPEARLAKTIRSRIGSVLRGRAGAKKTFRTEELIGCSIEALKLHLESQFTDGMTMEALMHGEIHCDHHIPCAAFDLTKVEHQLICFNYRNLKPMRAKTNIQKSDKMIVDGKEVRGRNLRKQNIIPFQKTA